jgi:ribosomal protein S18 acetylase RimI-like enzyme
MDDSAPCIHLEWDSKFFGRRIARARASRLGETELARVLGWAREESVDCLYLLLGAGDLEGAIRAQATGFCMVDVRVTLDRDLSDLAGAVGDELPPAITPCTPQDIAALIEIARVSHTDSRFYADGRFPQERCGALYATWIENSCAGSAEEVLVARDDGRAVGYVTCHENADGSGQIGLIAVADEARGRRLGHHLVRGSLIWFATRGRSPVRVVTQGRNVAALRTFEDAGFRTRSVELWFHLWPTEKTRGASG